MANGKFVTYYRVSTQRQGVSGLGLDAQRESVRQHLNGGSWEVVQEFVEVESGRKTDDQRPKLAAALAVCKKQGAVLLVAKLDRLARNVHFVSGLMESKVKFMACDLPQANELTIHIMAAFSEYEAKRIGERTKDALKAAKARGVVLGRSGAANLKPNIEERQAAANAHAQRLASTLAAYRAAGMSQRKMVDTLNDSGAQTARGGSWSLTQLQRVLARVASTSASSVKAADPHKITAATVTRFTNAS
jgi:DNA invertase Pin-like site-specific DNA recombinase